MSISAKRLVQETGKLLKKCGVGYIAKRPPNSPYPGDFEVRVPLHTSKSFVNETIRLASQFNLPRPMFQTFLDGKVVNERSGYIEASYLYDKEGIEQLMNVLDTAFQHGRPDGFMDKELKKFDRVYRP